MRSCSGWPAALHAACSSSGFSCAARNSSPSPWSTSSGRRSSRVRDQFGRVPCLPRFAVVAQVSSERLLAPWHLRRRDDRRERGHAAVAARIPQRDDQRAMPAHRMPADRARIGRREIRFDQRGQLRRHVVVHAVMRRPRRLCGVDVEARALAQVVTVRIGDLVAARAGVGRDQDHAVLGGIPLRAGLGDEVLLGAGQAGQPVQHRAAFAFPPAAADRRRNSSRSRARRTSCR